MGDEERIEEISMGGEGRGEEGGEGDERGNLWKTRRWR